MPASAPWTTGRADLDARLAAEVVALRSRSEGRTLELAPGATLPEGGTAYDTVLSLAWLPGRPDLPEAVRSLAARLAPGGRLLLLEPTRVIGWRGAVAFLAAGRRLRPPPSDVDRRAHLDRDVSAALWAHGLRVVQVDHLELGGAAWSLRHWLSGEARFPPTAALAPSPARSAGAPPTAEEETT